MPRNVWTVAGEEVQGFNDYLNRRGDQQQKRADYNMMVELRRDNLRRQLAADEARERQNALDNEYRNSMAELRKEEGEFRKEQMAAQAAADKAKADREASRLSSRQALGSWYQDRMSGQGEEGFVAPTNEEFMVAGFQNNVHPDDFNTYMSMLKKSKGPQGKDYTRELAYQKELAKYKAGLRPSPTGPKPTSGMIEGRNMTPRGAANMQGSLMYNKNAIIPMERNVMGAENPLWNSTNRSINELENDYRNYSQYNEDPYLIDQALATKKINELKAQRGPNYKLTESDYQQIAFELVTAKQRAAGQ